MGYLTPVILLNDAMHEFREDPKLFGEAILDGVDKANRENGQVSVGFKGYCNYINVERSRHADHHALFLSMGNCVTVVGAYEKDWEDLIERNPELAGRMVKEAESILKFAKKQMKLKLEKQEKA
jgi:hypothetical protein